MLTRAGFHAIMRVNENDLAFCLAGGGLLRLPARHASRTRDVLHGLGVFAGPPAFGARSPCCGLG